MDELPELPFEKVLSYLSLKDRLKARAVSRGWYHRINISRVKSLCISTRPLGFIWKRWITGAFAQNFICSTRPTVFLNAYKPSILANLKRLRLCDLRLNKEDSTSFAGILNSFGQLNQLDIILVGLHDQKVFNLNLPMLTSIRLENVGGINKVTLQAPRLLEVKIMDSPLRMEIVNGEKVKRLSVGRLENIEMENLKELEVLYVDRLPVIDSTLLLSLQQLKEFHTQCNSIAVELFQQKKRYNLTKLKVYFCGLLLKAPEDATRNEFGKCTPGCLGKEAFAYLAKNPSRLADEIPFYGFLRYEAIEDVASGLEVEILKRFTRLFDIRVTDTVQDVQRFLNVLKNFSNIVVVLFYGDQPQHLFDQLPEHCEVQMLTIITPPSDLEFLFQMKHLNNLSLLGCNINSQIFRKAIEELPLLCSFNFENDYRFVNVKRKIGDTEFFNVSIHRQNTVVSGLNAVIKLIFKNQYM